MVSPGRHGTSALVPSGVEPISYPCLRSLGSCGINTILVSEHDDLPQSASTYCDELITLTAKPDEIVAYKDELLEAARRADVRTILPTREHDAYVLAKYADEFEDVVSVVSPSLDTLATVQDRVRLVSAANEAGVPTPETHRLSEAEFDGRGRIIKSRFNLLTDDYLHSYPAVRAEEIDSVYHLEGEDEIDRKRIRTEMKHDPIVQEYVPNGGKYMFAGLYDHGEPVATFQHRQIRGDSYIGGGGVYRKSVYDPDLEQVARKLLSHIDWHGLACIEYIQDANTGEFKLLEINPRFWQSLPSTVRSKADFPYYYWLQATGRVDQVNSMYEIGTGSHLLYGELGYLMSLFRDSSPYVSPPSLSATFWEILKTCYEEPKFDYLRLDDPQPFVRGVLRTLKP